MKVLHVIDRLEIGGAEKVFVGITKLLAEKGNTVGALLFSSGSPLDATLDNKVKLHGLNRTSKYNLQTLYKAHSICNEYDIVHAHLRHVYAYMRLAQWLFNGKYKLITHDHAGVTEEVPRRFKGILKPRFYIGVNKVQTSWAINRIGVAEKNTYLLENTILFDYESRQTGSQDDKAMMVANIRSVKNIEFAIELCKQMGWSLDIYGNVIEETYYRQLLQKADSSIRIIQGQRDFSNTYQNYKIAIHCSHEETGPLVLIEYLSVGLPFIAYQTGSAADAIVEDLPELFMQRFNVDEWEQRIKEIITDGTLPTKMRRVYKAKFNPEQYINKCLSIYKSVLS